MKAEVKTTLELVIRVYSECNDLDFEVFEKATQLLIPYVNEEILENLRESLTEIWLMGERMKKWDCRKVLLLGFNTLHEKDIKNIYLKIINEIITK